jgi:enoyl-CoA hydratase
MEYLTTSVVDKIATVVIDRPPVNAMNRQMYREITETFLMLNTREDVNVVVIKSNCEKAFLAGADIKAQVDGEATGTALSSHGLDRQLLPRECFWSVYDCVVPVIAAVNGAALGAGLAIVACADIIVASNKAVFGLTELDVGLLGGSAFLTRLVGPVRMRKALYTAERISAQEMHQLGAVGMVVEPQELETAAYALAKDIAAKGAVALRLAKESLNRVEALPLKEAYRTEQDYTTRLRSFGESREAMMAFLEHRNPDYSKGS